MIQKRTIAGFIRSNMDKINKMQYEGYYLETIYENIKKDFPEDFSFKTFKDSIYKIRRNSKTSSKNINDNQILNQNNKFDLEKHKQNKDTAF